MSNIHFLLRYSDKITQVDTIHEHEKVLESHGEVWMGKFGLGMSNEYYDIAKKQLEECQDTFLYLMSGAKYTHKAKLIDLSKGKTAKSEIECKEKLITPFYYRNKRCSIWFKLKSIEAVDSEELDNLWLYKSPSCHPSGFGMRGLIYLTYRNGNIEDKTEIKEDSILYTGGLFDG